MAYPDIILTRRMRIAFMLTLITAFLIIAPLILLFTAGYRYDFTNHTVMETGVISVDVFPRDAEVYLNGVKIDKKIPIRLANRAPGLYQLSIKRDGYQEWSKDIEVKSKQTTYVRDLTLFPHASPQKVRQFPYNILEAKFSHDGRYLLAVIRDKNMYEVRLYDTNSLQETTITRDNADRVPHISWSPTVPSAVIAMTQGNTTYTHIFSAMQPDAVKVYSHEGTITSSDIQWSTGSEGEKLFVRTADNTVHSLTQEQATLYATAPSNAWYADPAQDTLWFYEESRAVLTQQKDEKVTIFSLPIKIRRIIDTNGARLIVQTTDNTIAIIPFSNQQLGEVKSLPTTSIAQNAQTGEWISWSDSEIWNIHADGNANLLNRTSENIESVMGLDQYGVLLMKTGNGLIAFNPGYYTTHTLLPIKSSVQPIALNTRTRHILFFAKVEEEFGLYKLKY